jgi:hypothetical protein
MCAKRLSAEAMSEWQDMQQKSNTKLRDLFKGKKAKTRKLSELSKTAQNRLAKLNRMLDELRCGKTCYPNPQKINKIFI